jgi:hypothetical protein
MLTLPPDYPTDGDRDNFKTQANAYLEWQYLHVTEVIQLIAELTALAAGTAIAPVFTFDGLSVAMSDPGAGKVRLNGAPDQDDTTQIAIDLLDAGGQDQSGVIGALGGSTNTWKGLLTLVKRSDPTKWLTLKISAVAVNAGWAQITGVVIQGTSANPFADTDDVIFKFTPYGDQGLQGASGAIAYEERANTTAMLVSSDGGHHIKYTGSGDSTLPIDNYATLGNGWWVIVESGRTGKDGIQITADGGTYKIYPQEVRLLYADTVNARISSRVLRSFVLFDSSAGTWLTAPGYIGYDELGHGSGSGGQGGGSGGSGKTNGGGTGASGGTGGGSGRYGQCAQRYISAAVLPPFTSVAYSPGAGGTGGNGGNPAAGVTNASGNDGNGGSQGASGNATTIGSANDPWYLTAPGGSATGSPNTGVGQRGNGNGSAAAGSVDGGSNVASAALASPLGYVQAGNAVGPQSAASTATASTSGGAGTAGGASNPSPFNPTTTAGGTAGNGSTALNTAGIAGSQPAQAAPGAGGAGGGGGGGSYGGVASGTSGASGAGGKGGTGGDGFVRISGRK